MMIKYSVTTLNKLSKKKDIYCIGCGKRLHEMLELYKDEPFVKRITTLIDNNNQLHGQEMEICGQHLKIVSVQILQNVEMNSVIILITSDQKKEIYKTVVESLKNKQVQCGEYPTYYYTYSDKLLRLCCKFPIRRRIIFNAGIQPHENADTIVDYLNKEYGGKPFDVVYMTDDLEVERKTNIKTLDRNLIRTKHSLVDNLKYCYTYATAKFILYENEPLFKVRKEQKAIYLNHGTIPLKKVKDVLKQPDDVDYGTCPAKGCADIYEEQYGISREKQLYIMPPRVQQLFNKENGMHKIIDYKEEQVVIWLPTFRYLGETNRKDSKFDNPLQLLEKDTSDEIRKKLRENNQILVIKQHPRDKFVFSNLLQDYNIRLLTDQMLKENVLSLHSILGDTDALITDYSGIAFEYLLLDRPVGYVISDMADYTRGFSVDNPFDYMPGPKINNIKEFLTFLDNLKNNIDDYEIQREELSNKLFGEEKYSNGAKALIEQIDMWEKGKM